MSIHPLVREHFFFRISYIIQGEDVLPYGSDIVFLIPTTGIQGSTLMRMICCIVSVFLLSRGKEAELI